MPGKISGISYKSGRCGGCQCVMFQFCRSVLFLRLAVRTAYIQHTEAEDNVEEMDAFLRWCSAHHSGDADATFQGRFFGAHRLIIECSVPAACIFNGGCGCVSLEDALLRL